MSTALAIVAFEPNLIAHGSIVTTDMAISATACGAVYALYRFGKEETFYRFVLAGMAFGLMLAAKHSAVMYRDSAVIRYQAQLRVSVNRSPGRPVKFWHTDVYEKRNGQWQIVWSHATQVQEQ